MTKKEFRKQCRKNKTTSYKLMVTSYVILVFAILLLLGANFLMTDFYIRIISFVTVVILARDFKAYQNK